MAGAALLSGTGGAAAETSLALGTSSAQSMQVTPHEGSLAVGAIFGSALAGVTGQDAKAQSEGLDLGAIGTAMQAYNCGSDAQPVVYNAVPEPLETETGAPGAAQGISEGPNQSDYPEQLASGIDSQTAEELENEEVGGYDVAPGTDYFADEHVQATDGPYGEADTGYAGPFSDPTGAITISGMESKAWAGVVDGVDETGASSDIAQVSLANGAVVLDGLDWTSASTESGQQSGAFTIGKVLIGGVALPDTADLSAVLRAVNSALSNLGLELGLPSSSVQDGYQYVDPLEIEVVPDATRDQVEQSVVDSVDPTYYQIANGLENGFSSDSSPYNSLGSAEPAQIEQALCNSDTPITVVDVTIASMDGGGYFNVALGGVSSTDGVLPANPYDLTSLGLTNLNLPGTSQFIPGAPATPGTAGTLVSSTPPKRTPSVPLHEAILAQPTGFSPGGPLLAAALGGLGLLALLVEGDRRLMRRAQRATSIAKRRAVEGGEA